MSAIDDLRLKILDRPQVVLDERVGTGDGVTTEYRVRHYPVMKELYAVCIDGKDATGFAMGLSDGLIMFNEAPPKGLPITATYDFAAFLDDELQEFIDDSDGSIAMAAGKALGVLIGNRKLLVTWSRGSTKVDYDQLCSDLADVAKRFLIQGNQESSGRGKSGEVDWEEVV